MKRNFCSYIHCIRSSDSTLVTLENEQTFYCHHYHMYTDVNGNLVSCYNKNSGLRPEDEHNDSLPAGREEQNIDFCTYITSNGKIRKYGFTNTRFMKGLHIYVEPLIIIAAFEKHKKRMRIVKAVIQSDNGAFKWECLIT